MSDRVQDRATQRFPDVDFNVNVRWMEKLIEAATCSSLLIRPAAIEAMYDSDGYDHNSECDP
jgi:hypothetical protein